MNQRALLFGSIALVAGLFAVLIFTRGFPPGLGGTPAPIPPGPGPATEGAREGEVAATAASARTIELRTDQGNISVAVSDRTELKGEFEWQSISFADILPGLRIRAEGTMDGDGLLAERITLLDSPEIIVYEPDPEDALGLPAVITGIARAFENNVPYRILNSDGSVLTEGFTTADAPDVGMYGRFEIRANYPQPRTGSGHVEVFESSARDGEEINKVRIPVKFQTTERMTVKVHLTNPDEQKKTDPNILDCAKTYPVERSIPRTTAPARAALEELLAGPTASESRLGYRTSLNPGIRILDLVLREGILTVDLSSELDQPGGGSCRVESIRSQIESTLKQFASVKSVVICREGTCDPGLILQP